MSTRRFTRFAWGVLAYTLGVILWGYFLRVSESGDGCGTDWPLCNGQVVPATSEFPTWVELIHRVSSGIALVLSVALAVWAFRIHEAGHAVRRAAGGALLFTIGESVFGALLVVFGLVATDISTARILIRPFHVTNTFLLMACLGLTAWWAWRGVHRVPGDRETLRPYLAPILGVGVIATTGSWTGLAGTAFPVETVGEGLAQYLSPEHGLVYLRTIHPIVAVVVLVLLGRLLVKRLDSGAGPVEKRLIVALGALGLAQVAVGPLTIALLHPTGLRLLHLGLADLLWLTLLFFCSAGLEASEATSGRSYSPAQGSGRIPPGAARPS